MTMKRKRTRRSTSRGRRGRRGRPSRAVGVGQMGDVVVPLAMIPALTAVGKAAGLGAAGSYTARRALQKLFKSKKSSK